MADESEKQMTSQAEIDAAFAAAATAPVPNLDDGVEGAAAAPTERILNQDEIDSLLGFDVAGEQVQDKSGVRAIINSTLVSYERLPMLEIVFDRLVRLMTTSLRNFTSDNVEVSLDNITSIRFGDYLNSIPLPAILAVFHAEQLDNYGLFTVDSNLIYSIVDVLLGGRRGTAAMRIEGRPYTTIERVLVQRNGNVSIDVTDDVHPATTAQVVLAAKVVGLDIAGVDLVCEDISRPLAAQRGAVVEVNASPGLHAHLHPSSGTPRPVGREAAVASWC